MSRGVYAIQKQPYGTYRPRQLLKVDMLFRAGVNESPPGYRDEYIGGLLLATSITFLVIETIFMLLLYTSRYLAHGEQSNRSMEIFMTLTYIVCLGKITIAILMVKIGGIGYHLVTLSPSTISNALKLSTALQIVCPLTTSLSKLGVLCFLYRILALIGRWYRNAIQITFGLALLIMLVQALIPFINCRPFHKTWDPRAHGTCAIPELALWRYLGIPNVATTIIVVAIPLPALAKLQVSRSVRIGLSVVFSVCILGVVAAIMRFRAFLMVKNFNDITYENVKPLCWTVAESGICLVAGIMATLKPLFSKIFKGTALERMLNGSTRNSINPCEGRVGRMWYQRETQLARIDSKGPMQMYGEGVSVEQVGPANMSKEYVSRR